MNVLRGGPWSSMRMNVELWLKAAEVNLNIRAIPDVRIFVREDLKRCQGEHLKLREH